MSGTDINQSPSITPIDPAALTAQQTRAWVLPPVYRRLRVGGGEFLAELRSAAALFMRFTGIDFDADDAQGKLDGFRFRQDTAGSPDEAKTLAQAAMTALKPELAIESGSATR